MNRVVGLTAVLMVTLAAAAVTQESTLQRVRELFGMLEPVPPKALRAPDAVLGRQLFWDERLSLDGRTSCASCHAADAWAADSARFSRDARGRLTTRNSQTVFNAMGQVALRWLGDRKDGATQAEGSITGSMGLPSTDAVVPLLTKFGYEDAFRRAFPGDPSAVSSANYARAIQAYLTTLVTPTPFDAYLRGDRNALTADQQAGLEVFISTGCANCHNGPRLGGNSFQKFGVKEEYWLATKSEPVDPGRYAVTKNEADRYVFRTPTLRNIARTAPYFHDGSVATLKEAVQVMARVQLGRALADADADRIVWFLESLTGDIPRNYSRPPAPVTR